MHGVCTVCVPHFGDQEMNAVKVVSKVSLRKVSGFLRGTEGRQVS